MYCCPTSRVAAATAIRGHRRGAEELDRDGVVGRVPQVVRMLHPVQGHEDERAGSSTTEIAPRQRW